MQLRVDGRATVARITLHAIACHRGYDALGAHLAHARVETVGYISVAPPSIHPALRQSRRRRRSGLHCSLALALSLTRNFQRGGKKSGH